MCVCACGSPLPTWLLPRPRPPLLCMQEACRVLEDVLLGGLCCRPGLGPAGLAAASAVPAACPSTASREPPLDLDLDISDLSATDGYADPPLLRLRACISPSCKGRRADFLSIMYSEAGPPQRCRGCGAGPYCSEACMGEHWGAAEAGHRQECGKGWWREEEV